MKEMTVLEQEMDALMQSITHKIDYHREKMMNANTRLKREWHESELNFYERKGKKIRDLIIRLEVHNMEYISEEFKTTMDFSR